MHQNIISRHEACNQVLYLQDQIVHHSPSTTIQTVHTCPPWAAAVVFAIASAGKRRSRRTCTSYRKKTAVECLAQDERPRVLVSGLNV